MVVRHALAFLCLMLLGACESMSWQLGQAQTTRTSADKRLVIASPIPAGDNLGHFRPSQVVCAEPSPDVAKAVSEAFNAGITVEIKGNTAPLSPQAQGDIAAAVSRSRAEAIAELTERLATISLLRDGLYRACEAYGNGALNPISYAIMLSAYGDTMVTLLSSELVAGNFGRQRTAIGATASGEADATSKRDQESLRESELKLEGATQELIRSERELAQAEAAAKAAPDDAAAANEVVKKREAKDKAEDKLKLERVVHAKSSTAVTLQPGAALTAQKPALKRSRPSARCKEITSSPRASPR
jgi:hypothetical protein